MLFSNHLSRLSQILSLSLSLSLSFYLPSKRLSSSQVIDVVPLVISFSRTTEDIASRRFGIYFAWILNGQVYASFEEFPRWRNNLNIELEGSIFGLSRLIIKLDKFWGVFFLLSLKQNYRVPGKSYTFSFRLWIIVISDAINQNDVKI